MAEATYRETVGVFRDESTLRSAADALLIAGFDRSSLSLLADHARVVAKLGHDCESVAELEDDPGVPTRPYVAGDSRVEGEAAIVGVSIYISAILAIGIVVAAGGTALDALIAAAIVGAAVGAAAYMLVRHLEGRHRRYLTQQIERGGIPLWVRCPDRDCEQRAIEILRRHGASDVHSHAITPPAFGLRGGESYQLSFMRALGL